MARRRSGATSSHACELGCAGRRSPRACSTESSSWRRSPAADFPLAESFLKQSAYGRHFAQHGERVLRMSVREAVADEEVDVLADALGPEGRLGEARGHREEANGAAVAG